MDELKNPNLSEEATLVQCDAPLNNNRETFIPIIAECIREKTDGTFVGLIYGSPGECGLKDGVYPSGECGLKDGAYPSENLIDLCLDEKTWKKPKAKHGEWCLKSGCPKGLLDSSLLLNPKGAVATDLFGKGDQRPDLESGMEINGGVEDGGGSFWVSVKRLFEKALNSFIPLEFGQNFDGSIKTVEPTFDFDAKLDFCKTPVNSLRSEVANQKSECRNGGNPKNTEVVGTGNIKNENGDKHIKPSSKKPPRPPRPPRPPKATADSSEEKLMKAMLKRAKFERMKKKQISKPKSSSSNVWALTFTLCFCVVMIMQGIFSQGNGSAQMSPEAAVQSSLFSVHKYANHVTEGEPWRAIELEQPSASLYPPGPGLDKSRPIPLDLKS